MSHNFHSTRMEYALTLNVHSAQNQCFFNAWHRHTRLGHQRIKKHMSIKTLFIDMQ